MARDYSTRRKPAKRGKGRAAAKPKNQGLPGWIQMLVGLTMGLLVAAGVYIYYKPVESHPIGERPLKQDAPEQDKQGADGLPPEEPSRFAFYEMLPNYELVIQYEDEDEQPGETTKPKTAETPKTVDEPGRYIIQAGSFQRFEDADKRKAKLALLGVESEIERITIDNAKTWYRVRIGPMQDIERVNELLGRLREEGIETLLMRHRG